MTPSEVKRRLIGRRIVDIKLNKFSEPKGMGRSRKSYDPTMILDNGDELKFQVEETEFDYGVRMYFSKLKEVSQ